MLHNAKTFKTKDVNKRPHMRRMDLTAALNVIIQKHHGKISQPHGVAGTLQVLQRIITERCNYIFKVIAKCSHTGQSNLKKAIYSAQAITSSANASTALRNKQIFFCGRIVEDKHPYISILLNGNFNFTVYAIHRHKISFKDVSLVNIVLIFKKDIHKRLSL